MDHHDPETMNQLLFVSPSTEASAQQSGHRWMQANFRRFKAADQERYLNCVLWAVRTNRVDDQTQRSWTHWMSQANVALTDRQTSDYYWIQRKLASVGCWRRLWCEVSTLCWGSHSVLRRWESKREPLL